MQKVRMYSTSWCPFCNRAKQLLATRGITEIEDIDIDADREAKARMVEETGRRSVPQIFIGNTHVGGCDDLVALDSRGELMPLLESA